MPAAGELLIDGFVTTATIAGGHLFRDDKAVMILALLVVCGLMAVKAIDALLAMLAHFVLVDDRILLLTVALRAFSRSADQGLIGLIRLDAWALPVNQECGNDQRKSNDDGQKNRAE